MAAGAPCGLVSLNHVGVVPNHANEVDQKQTKVTQDDANIDYLQRAQWLRAAVLGAIDGLVSVASLMMGVGAVKRDVKAMLLAGFAGCVAGACSMAIGEYVAVYTQYEVEVGQMKRDMMKNMSKDEKDVENGVETRRSLPNPLQAAMASAFSFAIGAVIPLLSAAFVPDYKIRLVLVVAVSSLALVGFGCLGAELGKTPKVRSSVRILVGGWMAMAITFGLTKLMGPSALE